MADKYMLEEMLENLVNENTERASELFHEFVVAKSREIYENLLSDAADDEPDDDDFGGESDGDEDDFDNDFGGDKTDDLHSDLDDMSDDDMSDDDEFGEKEFGDFEDESTDELLHDLTDIVSELQAKFEQLKNGGSDDEFGSDDSDDEFGSDDSDDEFGSDDSDDEEITDSFEPQLSTVREYVEKVGTDWGKSPKMGDNGANTKSIVAGKNDMGGTTANIARGGADVNNKGTKGGFIEPSAKNIESGNMNVPGGDAGKKAFTKKEKGWPENKGGDDGQNTSSLFRNKR